jgi:methionine-rich copper-binding protein CopC
VRHRPLVLLFAVVAWLCGPVLALAPQARAHNSFIGSVPSDGDTVTAPLTGVRLGFVDPPSGDATFAVASPSGERVDDSVATEPQPVEGYTVTIELKPLSETGRYTVEYFTVALDGVPLSGTFAFTYAGVGAAPESTGPGGAPGSTGTGKASESTGSGTAPKNRLPLPALLPAPLLLLGGMFAARMSRRRAVATSAASGATRSASCSECGTTVTPGQGFCVRCGVPLR